MVRFDGGGTGSLQISYSDWDANSSAGWPAAWHLGYQLSGTQGAMQIDLAPSPVVHLQTSEVDDRTELEANLDESFAGALREFVDAIENGRVPRVSAGDALRTFKQVWNAGLTRSVP
jgi:predicted dehydrogenase